MRNRPYDEIYFEKVPFRFMLIFVALFGMVSLVFLGLAAYQYFVGPIGEEELPVWFFLAFAIYMALMALLMASFREMTISLTYQAVTVAFGRMKKVVPWTDIEDYHLEKGAGLNGGIHFGIGKNGKLQMSYAVIGKTKIVLNLRTGKIKEFEFSVNNPDVILETIKKQIGKEPSQKL